MIEDEGERAREVVRRHAASHLPGAVPTERRPQLGRFAVDEVQRGGVVRPQEPGEACHHGSCRAWSGLWPFAGRPFEIVAEPLQERREVVRHT